MKKILVTGGAGYVGSKLVPRLLGAFDAGPVPGSFDDPKYFNVKPMQEINLN